MCIFVTEFLMKHSKLSFIIIFIFRFTVETIVLLKGGVYLRNHGVL